MSITITITDPTPVQIAALFGTLTVINTKEAVPAKAKAEPKAKPEEPAAEVEEQATDETTSSPSIDDVKAAAQVLVKANGREALAELLAEFKAENLSGLAEGKRAAFIAAAEKKVA